MELSKFNNEGNTGLMPARNDLQQLAPHVCYAVEFQSGERQIRGEGPAAFTISVADDSRLEQVLNGDDYSSALAFIRGEFDIQGDLAAAVRFKQQYSRRRFPGWRTLMARYAPSRFETWLQSRRRASENIRFHYDVSNEFYCKFLDSHLVYSAAWFRKPEWSLEQAQEAKLDRICRALDLRPGDRFLDVGCGWGGLLVHAATHYNVQATGCTLSRSQYEFTASAIAARGLEGHVSVVRTDYRDLSQRFNKIASIGMFEHVGRHRLGKYFAKIHNLLESGGLFLNSGIVRPQNVTADSQTSFLLRRVFPGGELAHLSDVVRSAERAGFGLIAMQSLRKDYARTCREWTNRLRENAETCVRLVGRELYRTWLLYLAAAAINFEEGSTNVFSFLMMKA